MATQGQVTFQTTNGAGNLSIFQSPIRNWVLPRTSGAWPSAAYKLVSAQWSVSNLLMNNVRREARIVLNMDAAQRIDAFKPYTLAYAEGSYYSVSRGFVPPDSLKGAASVDLGFYSVQGDSPENTGNVFSIRGSCIITLTITYEILQSEFSLNTTMIDADSPIRANVVAGSMAYNHELIFKFGTRSDTVGVASGVTYKDWIPLLDWLDQIPNAVSGLASCQLKTYYNGTLLGESAIQYFTIAAPASVVPTVSSLTATRVNNAVPADWDVYVQGKSGVNLSAVGAGAYGSNITGWLIQGDGKTAQAASMAVTSIAGRDNIQFIATATDSRGRTAQKTVTINVLPYSNPTISYFAVYRCVADGTANPTGTYAIASATGTYSAVGGNPCSMRFVYRLKGTTAWTDGPAAVAAASSTQVIGVGAFDPTLEYEIQAIFSDHFTSSNPIGLLQTAKCFMDRLPAKNIMGLFGFAPPWLPENSLYLPADGNIFIGDINLRTLI